MLPQTPTTKIHHSILLGSLNAEEIVGVLFGLDPTERPNIKSSGLGLTSAIQTIILVGMTLHIPDLNGTQL